MSPLISLSLATLGVAAVGLPLISLLRDAPRQVLAMEEPFDPATAQTLPTYVTVQYSGELSSMQLRLGGRVLADWEATDDEGEANSSPWMFKTELPADLVDRAEIELEATWNSQGPQAVTITLEPDALPPSSCTRWTLPSGLIMYDTFTFSRP